MSLVEKWLLKYSPDHTEEEANGPLRELNTSCVFQLVHHAGHKLYRYYSRKLWAPAVELIVCWSSRHANMQASASCRHKEPATQAMVQAVQV